MNTHKPIILTGTANKPFARKLAKHLGLSLGRTEFARFSDEEIRVIVWEDVKDKDVYIVQPTSAPANERIMELLLMAHAAKELGARSITAIIPFFGYRRQEKQKAPGETLAFELVTHLLKTAGVSRTLVMDLHKEHTLRFFEQADIDVYELCAFDVIINHFQQKRLKNFVVVAPDEGSVPESARYAEALHVPLVRIYKHRSMRKKDEVVVDGFEGDVQGKNVLIIDDEINTGGTLVGAAHILKEKGARNMYVAATHGILSSPAVKRLQNSPIQEVVITDTIELPKEKQIKKIHVLSVAPLFAEYIYKYLEKKLK